MRLKEKSAGKYHGARADFVGRTGLKQDVTETIATRTEFQEKHLRQVLLTLISHT